MLFTNMSGTWKTVFFRTCLPLLAAGWMVSCTTAPQTGYPYAMAAMKTGAGKQRVLEQCISRVGGTPESDRRYIAGLFGIKLADVPRIYCQRYFRALQSGRITEKDIVRAKLSPGTDHRFIKTVKDS